MSEARNPWKKPPTKEEGKGTPASLTEIMSEQLVKKIQAEEEGDDTEAIEESRQRIDAAAAEHEQEHEEGKEKEATTKEEAERFVTDEELARKLQAEEEDEQLARRLASGAAGDDEKRPAKRLSAEDAQGEAEEEGEEEDAVLYRGVKVYSQVSKTHVRMTAEQATRVGVAGDGRRMTTKHDPTISGRMNADKLQQFVDGDMADELSIPNRAANALREHARRAEAKGARIKEATSDPARTDLVLDTATRVTLLSLLNQDVIADLSGVLSTGKEANVYHAMRGPAMTSEEGSPELPAELAVKVFKTMNEFRGRDIYIDGKFLQQFSRAKMHPQKMIKMWAQKELRNLGRMHRSGVKCPQPIGLYGHDVLLMEFIGEGGRPAPQLRDIEGLKDAEWKRLYLECVTAMRRMFIGAKLVHADLSEFNMLLFRGRLWIIDVAQSVPNDHANAMTFLQRDCSVVTAFFRGKHGVPALTVRELYEFVTDPAITPAEEPERLAALSDRASSRGPGVTDEVRADEEVFAHCSAPRTLSDIKDPVEFDAAVKSGDTTAISQLTPQGLHHEPLTDMLSFTPLVHGEGPSDEEIVRFLTDQLSGPDFILGTYSDGTSIAPAHRFEHMIRCFPRIRDLGMSFVAMSGATIAGAVLVDDFSVPGVTVEQVYATPGLFSIGPIAAMNAAAKIPRTASGLPPPGKVAYIAWVGVGVAFRGQHLMSRMIPACLDAAKSKGFTTALIVCVCEWICRVAQGAGFSEVSKVDYKTFECPSLSGTPFKPFSNVAPPHAGAFLMEKLL